MAHNRSSNSHSSWWNQRQLHRGARLGNQVWQVVHLHSQPCLPQRNTPKNHRLVRQQRSAPLKIENQENTKWHPHRSSYVRTAPSPGPPAPSRSSTTTPCPAPLPVAACPAGLHPLSPIRWFQQHSTES